ncbi:unnamed protein product, partial [Rotaria magnacalcarata]
MSRWPDVRKWDESVIIEQFKLLKDQLTKESALELCRNAHENDVNALLGELLLDTHGDILNRNDIRQIAIMIRQAYKGYQGTDMGCCTAYDWKSQGYKTAYTIGVLFSSDQFCELMKSNSILGAQIAHEMLKN